MGWAGVGYFFLALIPYSLYLHRAQDSKSLTSRARVLLHPHHIVLIRVHALMVQVLTYVWIMSRHEDDEVRMG